MTTLPQALAEDWQITHVALARVEAALLGDREPMRGWYRVMQLAVAAEQAVRERNELRAELDALRAHELEVARISGIVHETDYHCHAGPRGQVIAALQGMQRDSRALAEQAIQRLAHRRDMVESAAFVREYYEHHRLTTEWPDGQRARDMREEAEAVADAFACTEVEQ